MGELFQSFLCAFGVGLSERHPDTQDERHHGETRKSHNHKLIHDGLPINP
jgi:hypothetical protein